jgi:hypothetical protein
MERQKIYDELENTLKDCDKDLLLTCKNANELALKKLLNKIKLEYYFQENAKRMNDEMKELGLIPNDSKELDNKICHRLSFHHGESRIYYDVYTW